METSAYQHSVDNTGASYLESAVYSINWGHAVAGI